MRLIDADVVERKIDSIIAWVDNNLEVEIFRQGCKASLKDLASTIKCYIPIIDAAPVVYGHWMLEREPNGKPYCLHCSVCDNDFHHIGIKSATDYCPNCGAKMEELFLDVGKTMDEVEHEAD